MLRKKQKLWEFAQKEKGKGLAPQTTEKILMILTAVIMGSIALIYLVKLLSMLLD